MSRFTFLCLRGRGFWFRVFGYGLHINLAKHHLPLFSERYGYRKAWYFAGLRVEVLKP